MTAFTFSSVNQVALTVEKKLIAPARTNRHSGPNSATALGEAWSSATMRSRKRSISGPLKHSGSASHALLAITIGAAHGLVMTKATWVSVSMTGLA